MKVQVATNLTNMKYPYGISKRQPNSKITSEILITFSILQKKGGVNLPLML